MDFSFTEEQDELAGLARRILADMATESDLRRAESGPDRFDPRLWGELCRSGVSSVALGEDIGGGGAGVIEQCRVLVELGRAVAPVPMLASNVVAAAAIDRYGSSEQRSAWAARAAAGELVLSAAFVEEGGAPVDRPQTRAERSGDGWRVSGTKTVVPAGAVAGAVLVPASTPEGAAVFIVRGGDPGTRVERQHVVDGDSEAILHLQDVRVGADRLLGAVGDGAAIGSWMLERGVLGLCALQLGTVERALELTAEYAKERVQFGRPIGTFQAVSGRLADCYIDVEAIRLTLWQAAWRLAEGLDCAAELATAKYWAADGGHRVAHAAVHIHGGVGIDLDYPLHRYFVAAKRGEFALGAATEHLRDLGALLADEPA